MKFMTFLEFFNNYDYKIPESKKELLFDFYTMSVLVGMFQNKPEQGSREFELYNSLKDAEAKLIPYLKKEILDTVFFSMCSEVRHAVDQGIGFVEKTPEGKEYARVYEDEKDPAETKNNRHVSYNAIKDAFDSNAEAVLWMKGLYSKSFWSSEYGGEAWVKIADCWLKIHNAKSINDLYVYINLMYDYQHNTGTVFNKSDSYKIEGNYNWIEIALNKKQNIKEPIELINDISPSLRTLALKIIKNKQNVTLQGHEKIIEQQHLKYKNYMEASDIQIKKRNGYISQELCKLYYYFPNEESTIDSYLKNSGLSGEEIITVKRDLSRLENQLNKINNVSNDYSYQENYIYDVYFNYIMNLGTFDACIRVLKGTINQNEFVQIKMKKVIQLIQKKGIHEKDAIRAAKGLYDYIAMKSH